MVLDFESFINESYNSDLFHFTPIPHVISILESDTLYANPDTDDGEQDVEFVSFSRTGNPKIGYKKTKNPAILCFDTQKIMSTLRGAKLKPFNYHPDGKYSKSKGFFEFEERLYNNLEHVSKYLKSITIYITDINECDDYCDEVYEIAEPEMKKEEIEFTDENINNWFISKIKELYPEVKIKYIKR